MKNVSSRPSRQQSFSAGATKYVVLSHDALKADEVQIPCTSFMPGKALTHLKNGATVDDATAPDGGVKGAPLTNKGCLAAAGNPKAAELDFTRISLGNHDMVFPSKPTSPRISTSFVQFNNTSKSCILTSAT